MKKFLTVLIGLTLLSASATSVSAADLPDEQWSILKNLFDLSADKTGVSLLGLSIQDNTDLSERVSSMVGRAPGIDGELGLRLCKTANDAFCAPGLAQHLTAFLPVCKSESDLNCIAGVVAIKDGVEIKGTYSRNFPAKGYTDFPADIARDVPEGSTPSLWNFEGITNGGGTTQYLTSFVINGGFQQDGKINFGSYYATINPVTIEAGQWGRNEAKDASTKSMPSCEGHCGMELLGHSTNDKFICASLDDGFCAIRQAFPAGVRFRINARLSQSPTGWLHGRLKSPNVEITPVGSGISISIEAEPVTVPVVGILTDFYKLPASMQADNMKVSGFQWGNGNAAAGLRSNVLRMPSPDSQEAFDAVQEWREFIKDKANASPTQWAVRSLANANGMAQCFKSTSELVGIVTTNSMVYLGTPPVFNKESQTLEYKVSSPHYTSKGDVFKGTYDLQLKADVARCLYGFSSAPISATVSIISESGDANIATTVVSERNGWLRMAAYGFTFSAPTLLVKLSQETPMALPTPEMTTQAITPIKKTISCIKGKSSKKVTSVNPKCPKGYKKKAA